MFALTWTYLTDRAVARAYHKGKNATFPEWPVHPDRVFQALVASWGNLGEPPEGTKALEWIEEQESPALFAPENKIIPEEYTVFVPTNDKEELPKKRVPRNFPSVLLPQHSACQEKGESSSCALIWENANPSEEILRAIEKLCDGVTHIGHSRSLVYLRITHNPPESNWRPATEALGNGEPLRVPHKGRLKDLCEAYAGGGEKWQRPPEAPYKRYIRVESHSSDLEIYQGNFASRLIILRKIQGTSLSLPQTLIFTAALRGVLLKNAEPLAREIISGHDENGTPTKRPHVAYFPLPFVGNAHADGHIMGFALAIPKELSWEKENALWKSLAKAMNDDETLHLFAGSAGDCSLTLENSPLPKIPQALREKTWCSSTSTFSTTWSTATPFVLDKLPPRRHKNLDQWTAQEICSACKIQNLPEPEEISFSHVSWLKGVPQAGDFPLLKRKDGRKRWHTHVKIVFSETTPLKGPLILGSGRFQGYGIFKPINNGSRRNA